MNKNPSLQEAALPFHHDAPEPLAPSAGLGEVPVKEAKAKLTELLRRVEAGERITLTRHGKPIADLVPHGETGKGRRMSVMERFAAWREDNPPLGIGWVSPDFDEPLPEDFLLQPFPDDFDEKLAEHDRRIDEARRKRDEQGG